MSLACPRCLGKLEPSQAHETAADCRAAGQFPRETADRLMRISIEKIDVADNVRVDLGDLSELVASIKAHGVLQPVTVHQVNDRFVLDYGHRRLAAAKEAGLGHINAIVREEAAPAERAIEQLVENLQRADLNAIEQAKALQAILAADPKLTQAALARSLGRSPAWLANLLRVLELDAEVLPLVAEGKLTAAHAKCIVALPAKDQRELADRAVKGDWSTHQLENQAKWVREAIERRAAEQPKRAAALAQILADLEKVAGKDHVVIAEQELFLEDLAAAGWPATLRTTGGQEVIGQPAECGCHAWQVPYWYAELNQAQYHLKPLCVNSEHIEARRAARNELWAAQDAARREAWDQREAGKRDRIARLSSFLQRQAGTPIARRLILYALLDDSGFAARYLPELGQDEAQSEIDLDWAAVLHVPIEQLDNEIAASAAQALIEQDPSDDVVGYLETLLAEPAPPAEPTKAKRAARVPARETVPA